MQQYLDLLHDVMVNGHAKEDRTGTGTLSVFGRQMRFNLKEGFPLVTTKKVHLRSIIHELLWFLAGDTNIQYLQENNVSIWDEWADENGNLGPVYGKQWREWEGADGQVHDQISTVINQLETNPDNRRIIVSAWNVGELDQMALAPCHSFFQFYTRELSLVERWELYLGLKTDQFKGLILPDTEIITADNSYLHERLDEFNLPRRSLSCQLYQRSADMFLGVPFNIASYALLTHMVAQQVNMVVEDFVWTGGDVHIYSNHFEQVKRQLSRSPLSLPQLVINRKPATIFDYRYEDFSVVDYVSHPAIKAPVAI